LSDLGLNGFRSHRWQLEASIKEPKFQAYMAECREKEREITSAGLVARAQGEKTDTGSAKSVVWFEREEPWRRVKVAAR
jgi:hypothetical protein